MKNIVNTPIPNNTRLNNKRYEWHKVGLLLEHLGREEFTRIYENKTWKDMISDGKRYASSNGLNKKTGRPSKSNKNQK